MKAEFKKYVGIMLAVFLLVLGIRYWDAIIRFFELGLHAAFPLILGCVIAYAVNILMSFYEEKLFVKGKVKFLSKGKRPICMVLAFVSLAAIITLIMVLVIPELVNCVKYLIQAIPEGVFSFLDTLEESDYLRQHAIELENFLKRNQEGLEAQLGDSMESFFSGVGNMMNSVFMAISSVVSKLITLLIAFIFSIYLLAGKERLGKQLHRILDLYLPKYSEKIQYVVGTFDECFHRFIVGQCIEAVILGSLCALGMTILRLPYALMIGTFIGFTALIPVAGAYIGGAVGVFMIVTESPVKAIFFLIFLCLLQQFEGNVIYPRVVGNSIGLPGMWVLAAVTIGGSLMGIVGILTAVPFTASIYHLLQKDIRKRNLQIKTAKKAVVLEKKENE